MRPLTASVLAAAALALAACQTALFPGEQAPSAASPLAAAKIEVAAPQWQVGDRWHYSDGYDLQVTLTHQDLTRFERTDTPGLWFSRRGFLREAAQSPTLMRYVTFRSVAADKAQTLTNAAPLVYKREYIRGSRTVTHNTSWTIESQERISVPAGDFDCIVIVWRSRNPESGWTGFERWWYAPAARNYVRMEYRYGEAPVRARVLMDFSLSQGAADVAALAPPPAL